MKRNLRSILAFVALYVFAALLLLPYNRAPQESREQSTGVSRTNLSLSDQPSSSYTEVTNKKTKKESRLRKALAMAELLPAKEFSDFLEQKNYEPAAIAAVFDLTQDLELLREGIRKSPDDWALLVRLALHGTDEDREPLRSRWISDFPDVATSYFMAMRGSANGGNINAPPYPIDDWAHDADLLISASQIGDRNLTTLDHVIMKSEALESIGASTNDAQMLATLYNDTESLITSKQLRSTMQLLQSVETVADEELQSSLAFAALASTEHISSKTQYDLLTFKLTSNLTLGILSEIKKMSDHGYDNENLNELTRINKGNRDKFSLLSKIKLAELTPSERDRYFDEYLSSGVVHALETVQSDLLE